MGKIIEHASAAIKAIQAEYEKGVIKEWKILPLINIKTTKDVGFAVIVYLSQKYDYDDSLLKDWKDKLNADEYSISAKRNQLQVKFTVRY